MRLPSTAAALGLSILSIAAAAPVQAGPPGYTPLLTGQAQDGRWELSAKHERLSGTRFLCLDLTQTFADGTSPGGGGGCFAGRLELRGNVAPVFTSAATGNRVTSSLIGGLVPSRARSVLVVFRDGARVPVRARPAVRGWSRLLGTRVRYFAADALAKTAARPRRVLVYDRRGRRIGRSHVGSTPASGSSATTRELSQ
jgi:hypothetical protein